MSCMQRLAHPFTPVAFTAVLCAALSACGGGGDAATTSSGSPTMSASAAGSTSNPESASATMVAQESSTATEATLASTQAVVAGGMSGSTVNCPGGGTAVYQLSGGTDDGVLAAGEVYSLTFTQCAGQAGAVAVSGQASVTIDSLGFNQLGATLAFQSLTAQLSRSNVVLNGGVSVGLSQTNTVSNGVLTSQQVASLNSTSLSVTRSTAARSTRYGLSAVDLTQTTNSQAGTVTSTSLSGSATLQATWPSAAYQATLLAQGDVVFEAGLPTSGQWLVTLPNSAITVVAADGMVTVSIDLGKDGTVDRTQTYPVGDWVSSVQ
jgi:hypothetical protein